MNARNLTDMAEELAALVSSNTEAYDVLMERYEPKLLRYIRRITQVSEQEAEDILQDVFLRVYVRIGDFDPDLKFSSWIYRVTHNGVISEHRKWSKKTTVPLVVDDEEVIQVMSDVHLPSELDQKILVENVQSVLSSLPLKFREPLELFYFEGKSVQEISDILRKPVGSIATLMRRGKQRCKMQFERMPPSTSLS